MREYFTGRHPGRGIRIHEEMAAGGLAGFVQVAATNPMEIVKLRMQLAGEGAGAGAVRPSASETIRALGLRGLYRGTAATWLRDVPFSFIFFPLFANLKALLGGEDIGMGGLFAAGAASGSLAAGCVTPCDVLKTRLQVVGGAEKYGSRLLPAAAQILREEGAGAFAKGLLPRMLVQAPLFGLTLLSYEVRRSGGG